MDNPLMNPTLPAAPVLVTPRLRLDSFREADIPALARILQDPEIAKGITAHTATPARARKAAAARLAWHNRSWATHGYGVWAIRHSDVAAPQEALIGWCGFTEPDIGQDPEILYGLAAPHWGQGLAHEAAEAAIAWLLAQASPGKGGRRHQGISAVIFGRINPASLALIRKLGFEKKGRMAMPDFLPDRKLAEEVIAYEIWRLARSRAREPQALLFEAPFKAGQIASLFPARRSAIADALRTAASARQDLAESDQADRMMRVRIAFEEGLSDPHLDWWHRGR
jgi:RimJ/RimL family protein N-acetyltransferase